MKSRFFMAAQELKLTAFFAVAQISHIVTPYVTASRQPFKNYITILAKRYKNETLIKDHTSFL